MYFMANENFMDFLTIKKQNVSEFLYFASMKQADIKRKNIKLKNR